MANVFIRSQEEFEFHVSELEERAIFDAIPSALPQAVTYVPNKDSAKWPWDAFIKQDFHAALLEMSAD